jgi:hypothetical protein
MSFKFSEGSTPAMNCYKRSLGQRDLDVSAKLQVMHAAASTTCAKGVHQQLGEGKHLTDLAHHRQ